MSNNVIETKNFKMYFIKPGDNTLSSPKFEVFIKYTDSDEKICDIANFCFTSLSDDLNRYASIHTCGRAFQDCIVSWELYKEFIMLVDIAYDNLKELQD